MNPAVEKDWEAVLNLLTSEWTHESGTFLRIRRCGVDLGGSYTNEVYNFVRNSRAMGVDVIATHGSSRYNRPIVDKPKLMDYDYNGQLYPAGAMVVSLGTDTAKDTLYERAKLPAGGPGTIHFGAAATPQYLQGWTAEHKVASKTSKTAIHRYEKKDINGRNEPIDTTVIALGMMELEPLMGGHQPGKMEDDLARSLERAVSQRRLECKADASAAQQRRLETQPTPQLSASPPPASAPASHRPTLPPALVRRRKERRKVGYEVPEDWL